VNTRTQGYLLLLFGGAVLRLGFSDLLLRYVKPASRPWIVLAGADLLVLAVAHLLQARRGRIQDDRGTGTAWLLIAPVVAIVVIAPPALGSFSANRAPAIADTQVHREFPALRDSSPHRLRMLDFTARVLWDAGRTVSAQDIQLTGFVLKQRPDGFVLARLVISCCAADARPVEVVVRSDRHPAADSWLTATGRYDGTIRQQRTFPVLHAESIQPVKQPTNPYD
jgi:uncharacterized repeat protein (TIGR03943 family)